MGQLSELIHEDTALRDVVRDIRRLLDVNLAKEPVEVLDAYQTDGGERRWVLYSPDRGFGLLGGGDSANPMIFFTSSLFLAHALEIDTSALERHKEQTAELQAELARRFPDPVGEPRVSVLMGESQAASFKMVLFLLRLALGWDRQSVMLSPGPEGTGGGSFDFFANAEGEWGGEHIFGGTL